MYLEESVVIDFADGDFDVAHFDSIDEIEW
jgi:hypothetical protein